MGNFAQGMWNGVVWFFNPNKDLQSAGNNAQKGIDNAGNAVQGAVNGAGNLLTSIKNDLDWFLVLGVGILAYAFIFKK